MSKRIYIDVGAKVQTVHSCVKLSPNMIYTDIIKKGVEYNGDSPVSISFTNNCSSTFVVPAFTLASDSENGGNFEIRVPSFTILANQTVMVPVSYHGVHKTTSPLKVYSFSFNGVTATYKLYISVPVVNSPPVINNINIELENRAGKVFTLEDFTSRYFDKDGDLLDAVILEGNVSAFRLNRKPIISGQEIPANLINSGAFEFLAQQTDDATDISASIRAKDEAGMVSVSTSTIRIRSAAKISIIFDDFSAAFTRGETDTKATGIVYNNASGQQVLDGQILYTSEPEVTSPLTITANGDQTLIGNGVLSVNIQHAPSAEQASQIISFTIYGSSVSVTLHYESAPIAEDIQVVSNNRETYMFEPSLFGSAYSDYDGDELIEVAIFGDVTGLEIFEEPYEEGSWIPINDVEGLRYIALPQDEVYEREFTWKAKSADGAVSA